MNMPRCENDVKRFAAVIKEAHDWKVTATDCARQRDTLQQQLAQARSDKDLVIEKNWQLSLQIKDFASRADHAEARVTWLEKHIRLALLELGVPQAGYPAPVVEAIVYLLRGGRKQCKVCTTLRDKLRKRGHHPND